MKIHENRDLGDVVRKYDYTAKLGRDRWAWEFLRRSVEFRNIARAYSSEDHVSRRPGPFPGVTLLKLRRPQPEAEAWGLAFFPNPDQDVSDHVSRPVLIRRSSPGPRHAQGGTRRMLTFLLPPTSGIASKRTVVCHIDVRTGVRVSPGACTSIMQPTRA